jgi:hypothetical protein
VRPGLLVLGTVIGVVGAGVLASAFFLPPPTTQSQLGSFDVPNLASGHAFNSVIAGTNVSSGTIAISWTSTAAIKGALYHSAPCAATPGVCPVGSPLVSWPANLSGRWIFTGALTFPLVFAITNNGPTMVTVQGTPVELYSAGGTPTWAVLAIIAGGGILIGIGALAVFFGLFLRGGIYRSITPAARPGEGFDGMADDPRDPRPP